MPRQLVVHDPERGMARSIPYDLTEEQADAWMADVRLLVVERPEAMLWMLDPEGDRMAVRAAGIVTLFVVSLDDPQEGATEGLEEMLAGVAQALEENGPSDDDES